MKKCLLTIVIIFFTIVLSSNLISQDWDDVVQEIRGDTLVIRGTNQNGIVNPVYIAIMEDVTPTGERNNPNRVYETIPGDTYISDGTAEFDATVPNVRIVAPAVDRKGTLMPPLHIKKNRVDGTFDKTFFQTPGSLYCSNQYFCLATIEGTIDREFARSLGDYGHFEYDNCIFEFTAWVHHFPSANHQTFKLTNCLFINLGREASVERGIVVDVVNPVDTVWLENNTLVNAGGVVQSRTWFGPNFCYINHNTFVNTPRPPILFGAQAEMIVTNNQFINTGTIPMYPGFIELHEDDDHLPIGIISVDTVEADWISTYYPDGYPVASEADRKLLVENNNVWWDPRFQDMFENQLTPIPPEIGETWVSQMILKDSRTQAMLDDNASYPYFVEGDWINIEPDFVTLEDRVPEWIDYIVTNTTPGAYDGGNIPPWWRTYDQDNFVMIDWPPLADLSYSDPTLYTAAHNGYPLGDLNWFPTEKTEWEKTGETQKLIDGLKAGELVDDWVTAIEPNKTPGAIQLSVSPNPFSTMVNVRYIIDNGTNVELIIYNLMGEKVRAIELGYQTPGIHDVTIERENLSPGMYILHMNTDYNKTGLNTRIAIN